MLWNTVIKYSGELIQSKNRHAAVVRSWHWIVHRPTVRWGQGKSEKLLCHQGIQYHSPHLPPTKSHKNLQGCFPSGGRNKEVKPRHGFCDFTWVAWARADTFQRATTHDKYTLPLPIWQLQPVIYFLQDKVNRRKRVDVFLPLFFLQQVLPLLQTP